MPWATIQPGIWLDETGQVDLLVPEGLAPTGGRRGARLTGHGSRAARKVLGLEGAAVDNEFRIVTALDPADHRTVRMRVASPAALLVAKLHKLGERREEFRGDRLEDKDAFDVYRLLQLPTDYLALGMARIRADDRSGRVGDAAIGCLCELFAAPAACGSSLRRARRSPKSRDSSRSTTPSPAGSRSGYIGPQVTGEHVRGWRAWRLGL